MCTALVDGGQRCAAHTRPRYQTAEFGTPEWDEAAAAYASTPTGRMELSASLAAAEEAGDVRSEVAFAHALTEGQRLREKTQLFRDELTNIATPTPEPEPEPATPSVFDEDDDYDYDHHGDYDNGRIGGNDYVVDEDEWDENPLRGWSPTMQGQTWNRHDPIFNGCTEEMTSNEFIDQVCENQGITRAEFEAAAADYLAQNSIALALPTGNTGAHTIGASGDFSNTDHLRFAVVGFATPHYTPAEIARIAEMAREQRDTAAAKATAQAAVTGTTPTVAARSRALPDVPDDPAALRALAEGNDARMRQAVAAHANTPADVLERLAANDAKVEVRAEAARNENLPTGTLTTLATDRSIKVRAGAARNPNMPTAHLTTLAADPNDTVKGAVARNPSTPADLYATLAAHDSATVRKNAARRADVPNDIARTLATDPDQQVRSALAKNRTTSEYILRGLATDDAQSVRAAAARHRNLPPTLLRGRLSRDPAPGVRAAVARNENTSLAALTRLTSDSDPWVRRNVAWNPTTPAILLYALTRDTDEGVASSARNRNTQGETAAS